MSSRVLLLDASYDDLPAAVARVFEAFPLPLAGKRVLVKPNILGPYSPERAVATHPLLVTAVVDRLLAAGADPVVGDNPGARGYGINLRCGEVTGIAAASRGRFVNLGDQPVEVPFDSPLTPTVRVSRLVLEADLVISLPKLKTHVQTIMTGGIKNSYGFLVGAEKSRLHSLACKPAVFGRLLADVFALRPPDLTIMDAVIAMEGDGPSSGTPRPVGKLLAARDTLALDAIAARLIGLDPEKIIHLRAARRRFPELGEVGEVGPARLQAVPGFKLPGSLSAGVATYAANWLVFSLLKKSRLRIRAERCTACGSCVAACPVGAMAFERGLPVVDRGRCIACYCCHELCPSRAIELSPFFGRFLKP